MNHRIIKLDDKPAGIPVIEYFDKAFSESLAGSFSKIVVMVPADAGSGITFIEWLSQLKRKCKGKNKLLCLVVEDSDQRVAIDYSHPELGLSYYESIEEIQLPPEAPELPAIEKREPPLQPAPLLVQPANASLAMPQVVSAPVEPMPIVASNASVPESTRTEETQPETPALPGREPYLPVVGCKVELSGEFVCCSCGMSRMWLRGDTMGPCENPECTYQEAGWKLTYELF